MKNIFADSKKRKITWCILCIMSIVFYLFWYWRDGVVMTVDGPTYIDMVSDREPGYCSFLWLFRMLLGKDKYLTYVVIVQCIIAAIATTHLTMKLQKRYSLGIMSVLVVLFIEYGMTILNAFVAKRGYSYYNSISTEALAFSLWLFFFASLIDVLYDKSRKDIIICLLWSVILISIRKQMLISLGLLMVVLIYIWWSKSKWVKAIVSALLITAIGLASVRMIDCSYNLAHRGVFAPHTGDASFILGNEIYVADENMVEYISSEHNQELFIKILEMADKNQYNQKYAQKGWQAYEDHYSNSYDRIKFDTVMVAIRENQIERGVLEEEQYAEYLDIIGTMWKELLIPCFTGMLQIFKCNFIFGLITTVLKVNKILNWLALIIYVCYIGLAIFLIRMKAYKNENTAVLLAILVLVSILINVAFCASTIFCQMRYMIYNTAFFYQAGWLMLIEAYRIKKG